MEELWDAQFAPCTLEQPEDAEHGTKAWLLHAFKSLKEKSTPSQMYSVEVHSRRSKTKAQSGNKSWAKAQTTSVMLEISIALFSAPLGKTGRAGKCQALGRDEVPVTSDVILRKHL